MDHLEGGLFGSGPDVVRLTRPTFDRDECKGSAVVAHVQPVPDVLAVAVHREGLAFDSVQQNKRGQLLRKLIRAVVVRTVGRHRVQAIGVVIGPHQDDPPPPSTRRRGSSVRTAWFHERTPPHQGIRTPRPWTRGRSARICRRAPPPAFQTSPQRWSVQRRLGPSMDRSTCDSAARL